ncbi:hypothetical protein [Thermostichus vulcanus]|uniref:hypothetical protein n=1 Tax=Thermostichus vulcanus TaxID=32053 RepID=UPI001FCC3DE4|nr:hypothetical protein [Thermostichus vulcanus]
MTQTGGVARRVRWAWGLGVCLGLYSLGAGNVQAQLNSNTRHSTHGIPTSEASPSPLQPHLPSVKDSSEDSEQSESSLEAQEPGSESTPPPNDLPFPGRLPRLTTPMARPQTPTPERWQPALPSAEAELFPFSRFPLLEKLDPPPPTLADLGIHLDRLALLPDADLAEQMDVEFSQQLARLNAQIADKQERLYRLLQDWSSSEADLRQIQAQLSELRTERDRLALEHLLMLRQLQDSFALPLPNRSAASSP